MVDYWRGLDSNNFDYPISDEQIVLNLQQTGLVDADGLLSDHEDSEVSVSDDYIPKLGDVPMLLY